MENANINLKQVHIFIYITKIRWKLCHRNKEQNRTAKKTCKIKNIKEHLMQWNKALSLKVIKRTDHSESWTILDESRQEDPLKI